MSITRTATHTRGHGFPIKSESLCALSCLDETLRDSPGDIQLVHTHQLLAAHLKNARVVPSLMQRGCRFIKQRLANNIVPFVIGDSMKSFYYRGPAQWGTEKGYLTDTCLAAQDQFKAWLDYYRIDA